MRILSRRYLVFCSQDANIRLIRHTYMTIDIPIDSFKASVV